MPGPGCLPPRRCPNAHAPPSPSRKPPPAAMFCICEPAGASWGGACDGVTSQRGAVKQVCERSSSKGGQRPLTSATVFLYSASLSVPSGFTSMRRVRPEAADFDDMTRVEGTFCSGVHGRRCTAVSSVTPAASPSTQAPARLLPSPHRHEHDVVHHGAAAALAATLSADRSMARRRRA